MVTRVDKCVTFGEEKTNKIHTVSAKAYYNEPVPPIKNDESIRYLGRHFDFSMSNLKYKLELVDGLESFLSYIDKLSNHPKSKLLLYQRHVLSKISWR